MNDTIELRGTFAPSLAPPATTATNTYCWTAPSPKPTGQAEGRYSGKVRREGVNLQVITADDGTLLWISPALPGQPMT
jgi:hypothetical protein